MDDSIRPLAVVTGASTGIGFELAKQCAEHGFDLVIASDDDELEPSAHLLRQGGVDVTTVSADLSTIEGNDRLIAAIGDRPVDALLANAGRGLGKAFLDQDFGRARKVIDTNVTGTIYLVHTVGSAMRARNAGRILITGSIAGFMPGAFQAVYNGTKSFLNSFSFALRDELKETNVTVSCLMPGPTDTEFFERGDLLDTKVGVQKKDDPAMVARAGFKAMMNGDGDVVAGWKNKAQAAVANITPSPLLAKAHRNMAEPGSAN